MRKANARNLLLDLTFRETGISPRLAAALQGPIERNISCEPA